MPLDGTNVVDVEFVAPLFVTNNVSLSSGRHVNEAHVVATLSRGR